MPRVRKKIAKRAAIRGRRITVVDVSRLTKAKRIKGITRRGLVLKRTRRGLTLGPPPQ